MSMQSKLQNIFVPFARFSLFVVYFWFGILKVIDTSPASPLVLSLLDKTMPFMNPPTFLMLFGLGEAILGVLFLFKKLDKISFSLLFLHLLAILMPLVLLPAMVWQSFLVPTLEGQYIIKNILIISAAFTIIANRRAS
jgi:uncharacterized membrane protein YkgB